MRIFDLAQVNARVNASGAQTELLSKWGSSTNSAQSQLYNASGQLAKSVSVATPTYPFGGDTNYNYEDRGQLGGETSARGATYSHAFAYDGAGNPTTWKGQSRTFNSNNQETTGGFFGYNGDGSPWKYLNRNLADAQNPNGKAQVYSYNVRGQLQQANGLNPDGTTGATVMQALYRGDGKRAWKQSADSTSRVYFFYDGEMLLGSSDQNGGSAEEVNIRLEKIMVNACVEVWTIAQRENCDLRMAAYISGVGRVAEAIRTRGIYR